MGKLNGREYTDFARNEGDNAISLVRIRRAWRDIFDEGKAGEVVSDSSHASLGWPILMDRVNAPFFVYKYIWERFSPVFLD